MKEQEKCWYSYGFRNV